MAVLAGIVRPTLVTCRCRRHALHGAGMAHAARLFALDLVRRDRRGILRERGDGEYGKEQDRTRRHRQ